MQVRPSQKENQSVNELSESLRSSIYAACSNGERLLSALDGAFLSIDEEALKILRTELANLGSVMWKLNVSLYKMKEFPERIVRYQEIQESNEWNEF